MLGRHFVCYFFDDFLAVLVKLTSLPAISVLYNTEMMKFISLFLLNNAELNSIKQTKNKLLVF